jgi:hypothetical protein
MNPRLSEIYFEDSQAKRRAILIKRRKKTALS